MAGEDAIVSSGGHDEPQRVGEREKLREHFKNLPSDKQAHGWVR